MCLFTCSRHTDEGNDVLLGGCKEGRELGVTVGAGVFIAAHTVRVNRQTIAVVTLRGEAQHSIFAENEITQELRMTGNAHNLFGPEEFPAAGAAQGFKRFAFLRLHNRSYTACISGKDCDSEHIPQVEGTVLQPLEGGQHVIRQLGRYQR